MTHIFLLVNLVAASWIEASIANSGMSAAEISAVAFSWEKNNIGACTMSYYISFFSSCSNRTADETTNGVFSMYMS